MSSRPTYFLVAVAAFVSISFALLLLRSEDSDSVEQRDPVGKGDQPIATKDPVLPGAPRSAEASEAQEIATPPRQIRLTGRVTSALGDELRDVRVTVRYSRDEHRETAMTDLHGRYSLLFDPLDATSYELKFEASGHETLELRISNRDLSRELGRNVVLTTLVGHTRVEGRVVSALGQDIEGADVHLGSATTKARHDARTDQYGAFAFPGVKSGGGYMILVRTESGYEDYLDRGLTVPEEGLNLEIVVDALGAGKLQGRFVGPEGDPIADVSFLVRSDRFARASLEVTSDSSGNFTADSVPTGILTLTSSSDPPFTIRGFALESGETGDVLLRVDRGLHSVRGSVFDDHGSPISSAKVQLSWTHQDGSLISDSLRLTTTDNEGHFRFEQVGGGVHLLQAGAPGFDNVRLEYGVGAGEPEPDLRLRRVER